MDTSWVAVLPSLIYASALSDADRMHLFRAGDVCVSLLLAPFRPTGSSRSDFFPREVCQICFP
jgi:hypothetical protein